MWAARDRATFEEMRTAHPRVRTVRGLHAKWREAENARLLAEAETRNARIATSATRAMESFAAHPAFAPRDAAPAAPPPSAGRAETADRTERRDDEPEFTDAELDRFVDGLVGGIAIVARRARGWPDPESPDWPLLIGPLARGGARRDPDIAANIAAAARFLSDLQKDIPHEE
jgi:hypothetical protein